MTTTIPPSRRAGLASEVLDRAYGRIKAGITDHALSRIIVIAGHYCVSPDLQELGPECDPEILSFAAGCGFHRQIEASGARSSLCLFINDIGISPEERQGLISSYALPPAYLEVLESQGLRPSDVEVVFESKIRNRASRRIRNMKKREPEAFELVDAGDPSLTRCIDAAYCEIEPAAKEAVTIPGPRQDRLVVKEGPNPKCNTILATLFEEAVERHRADAIVNCFNGIYINRLNLGQFVYSGLFRGEARIYHFLFDEEGLMEEIPNG